MKAVFVLFNSLPGLGRSAESCVMRNRPASSGLSSFHLVPMSMMGFASSNQTVNGVSPHTTLPSLERRDAWNELKNYDLYFISDGSSHPFVLNANL